MRRNEQRKKEMAARGYLGLAEAARAAGYSPSTVYRWRDEGLVDTAQVGSEWYVDVASLLRYIDGTPAERALRLALVEARR